MLDVLQTMCWRSGLIPNVHPAVGDPVELVQTLELFCAVVGEECGVSHGCRPDHSEKIWDTLVQ